MHPRLPRIKPSLLVNKHVDGVPYVSIVRDLSLSGIALKTPIEPAHAPDANILIEISFEDAIHPMWMPARLVRHSVHGVAAYAFEEVRLPIRRALQRFLESHQSMGEIPSLALNG